MLDSKKASELMQQLEIEKRKFLPRKLKTKSEVLFVKFLKFIHHKISKMKSVIDV